MTRLSDVLVNSQASGVYLLEDSSYLEEIPRLAKAQSFEFFHLEGRDIRNREQFLKRAAKALRFPDYLGNNWDAFADCLTDMSWYEGDGYVILYDHFALFAVHSRDDFETALDIFKESTEFWRNNGKSFFVLLWGTHVPELSLPGINL